MNIRKKYLAVLITLTSCLSTTMLYADWGVSIGAANQKNQYKGSSRNITIHPDLTYREDNQENVRNNVSYDLVLTSKNAGFKAKDNNVFKGMKTRKGSLDIGAQVLINTPLSLLTFEASKDLIASKGFQASAKLGGISPNRNKGFQIRPYAGIRYQSAKVINYHYGVRKSEATQDRKSYQGKTATTPFLGVETATYLSKNMQIITDLSLEKRASSIADSPLVNNKKNDLNASIRLIYWF